MGNPHDLFLCLTSSAPVVLGGMPHERLIQSYGWAHCCMKWLHDNDKGEFLLSPDTLIPTTTWFSGFGFSEWSLEFIAAARSRVTGQQGNPFSHVYQFEINSVARRGGGQQLLAEESCQFIDIQRLLPKSDLQKLIEVEVKTMSEDREKVAEACWETLKSMNLDEECQMCSKHLQMCKLLTSLLDISGSPCIHYSTMGKKVDGRLLRKNGPSNKLLQIYLKYHSKRRPPLLIHENVPGFDTDELVLRAGEGGYRHLAHLCVQGSDASMPVNPRSRVCFGRVR